MHQAATNTQLNVIRKLQNRNLLIQSQIFFLYFSTAVLRLQLNNNSLNQFLYQAVGSMFTITCQASGNLNWNGPDGTNISSSSFSNVYQSSGSLHFSSFNANTNGVYTCSSSLGLTESIMITNSMIIILQYYQIAYFVNR